MAEKFLMPLIIFSATVTLAAVFQYISAFVTGWLWDTSIVNIEDFEAMSENELKSLRLSQLFYQIGAFLVTPLFFALVIRAKPIDFWGLNKTMSLKPTLSVLLVLALSIISSSFLYEVLDFIKWPNEIIEAQASNESMIEQLLPAGNLSVLLLNILIFVVLPAFLEEIYFRGMVQRVLTNIIDQPHTAIIVTSFLFALVHGNFPGFLAYFAMGLVLGYLFYFTGNLRYSILFHLLNNGFSLVMDWLYRSGSIDFDPVNSSMPVVPGILATLGLAAVMYKLYLNANKPKLRVASDQNAKVVWVKIYESQDVIQAQLISDRLNNEGYDATVLNRKDSNYGHGYIEIHVPLHQVESATLFIEKISL